MLRSGILSSLALGGLAWAASACSEAPADGDCDKLLLHLVELEVNAGPASQPDKVRHKASLAEESRAQFVERCNSKLKATQVACGLKATTSEELDACDG